MTSSGSLFCMGPTLGCRTFWRRSPIVRRRARSASTTDVRRALTLGFAGEPEDDVAIAFAWPTQVAKLVDEGRQNERRGHFRACRLHRGGRLHRVDLHRRTEEPKMIFFVWLCSARVP